MSKKKRNNQRLASSIEKPTREEILQGEMELIRELGSRLGGMPFQGQGGGKPKPLEWHDPLAGNVYGSERWFALHLPDSGRIYNGYCKTLLSHRLSCSVQRPWEERRSGYFDLQLYLVVLGNRKYWVCQRAALIGKNPSAVGGDLVRCHQEGDDIESMKIWAKQQMEKKLLDLSRARSKKLAEE